MDVHQRSAGHVDLEAVGLEQVCQAEGLVLGRRSRPVAAGVEDDEQGLIAQVVAQHRHQRLLAPAFGVGAHHGGEAQAPFLGVLLVLPQQVLGGVVGLAQQQHANGLLVRGPGDGQQSGVEPRRFGPVLPR
ncbi:MAG: hypothetical protein MUE35_06620 [Hydrogenophaga sp.]|nr:hypothetical protein [Hydrogenophaga sp.]